MIIEYDHSVSLALREILEPRFDSVAYLFPGWCEKLVVYWDTSEADETILTCNPRHEYRIMSITVHPLFLSNTFTWEDDLIHEIQHGLVRPLIAKIDRIVEKFVKDDTITEYINDELAEIEEAVCEDLAILAKKLKQNADV